jgi:GNAT superfamily N-acetyltransferase
MPVQITMLSKTDVDQYLDLLRLGFGDELGLRGTNIFSLGTTARVMLSMGGLPMRAIKAISGSSLFVLVAKDGDRVVGILTVLEGRIPALIGVYVIRQYRAQKIAFDLVEEALRLLREHGYSKACVCVIHDAGKLLAQRAGFAVYDHTDLYEHSRPTGISTPQGLSVRTARKLDLPRHPFDLGPLNLFTGVRVNRMVVDSEDHETVAATLIALPKQSVGEIQPKLLVPGSEDTFCALLSAAEKWFSHLGRTVMSVSLRDHERSLAGMLEENGFVKRQSWVNLERDL